MFANRLTPLALVFLLAAAPCIYAQPQADSGDPAGDVSRVRDPEPAHVDGVLQKPIKIPTAVRNAGVYRVATGEWTRPGRLGSERGFGPDVIYDNTAASGYFNTVGATGGHDPGSLNYDYGGLPGTTNGHAFANPPTQDAYLVEAFEIGYCDMGPPATAAWELEFYSYLPLCGTSPSSTSSITLSGFPAAGACWTVVIDLTGGSEFVMEADGGPDFPGWDNVYDRDRFGWSFKTARTDMNVMSGFLISGNPSYTDSQLTTGPIVSLEARDTVFGLPSLCTGGTGYLNRDIWFLQGLVAYDRCGSWGGYRNDNGCGGVSSTPFGGWHMKLFADARESGPITSIGAYCLSTPNSTGTPTTLDAFGSSIATANNVTLTAGSMPLESFGFFITSTTPGFVPVASGVLCVQGAIGRFVAPGQIKNSGQLGEISLSTTAGEWSTASIPTPVGSYAAMAGQTTYFQAWHREPSGGSSNSHFSHGLGLVWQ